MMHNSTVHALGGSGAPNCTTKPGAMRWPGTPAEIMRSPPRVPPGPSSPAYSDSPHSAFPARTLAACAKRIPPGVGSWAD